MKSEEWKLIAHLKIISGQLGEENDASLGDWTQMIEHESTSDAKK